MQSFKDRTAEYIDAGIKHWNHLRITARTEEDLHKATYYLDAFQSFRSTLFGAMLDVSTFT